jgi:hypothetical protein
MNILKTLRSEAFSFVYFIEKILLHKASSSIHATAPTADRDFKRFQPIITLNPLVSTI